MNLVGEEFMDRVLYYKQAWLPARDLVKKAILDRYQVSSSSMILLPYLASEWSICPNAEIWLVACTDSAISRAVFSCLWWAFVCEDGHQSAKSEHYTFFSQKAQLLALFAGILGKVCVSIKSLILSCWEENIVISATLPTFWNFASYKMCPSPLV